MKIDKDLISQTMNHLVEVHDALCTIRDIHQTFMTDEYIKVLGKTIDSLAFLKYRAVRPQEYLDRAEQLKSNPQINLLERFKKLNHSKTDFYHAIGGTARHPAIFAKITAVMNGEVPLTEEQKKKLEAYLQQWEAARCSKCGSMKDVKLWSDEPLPKVFLCAVCAYDTGGAPA